MLVLGFVLGMSLFFRLSLQETKVKRPREQRGHDKSLLFKQGDTSLS